MRADRLVRFTDEFFDRLDTLLAEERTVDGSPSVTDFLVFDVPLCGLAGFNSAASALDVCRLFGPNASPACLCSGDDH